jgi:NAD(P)H-hydrate epimerase
VGELIVADIGIPKCLYEGITVELVDNATVAVKLPDRPPDAHKGTFGHAVVIAGSLGFTGAAALASEAVLRAGAGLSTLGCAASLQDIMASKLTEVMTRGLPDDGHGAISSNALDPALELIEKGDSAVVGCGLGTHPGTCELVHRLVKSVRKPMIIDADGLNALSDDISTLEGVHGDLVLTPHPGEMARLLGTSTAEVQSNRLDAVRAAASRFNSTIVLKGARTLIAEPSGRVYVNPTGGPGLATGGTGDVLAGAIGGLLAQRLSALDAAICGAFFHGRAGDIAADELGAAGVIAGDVLRTLPYALRELYAIQSR